jgi:hypothetical protein
MEKSIDRKVSWSKHQLVKSQLIKKSVGQMSWLKVNCSPYLIPISSIGSNITGFEVLTN